MFIGSDYQGCLYDNYDDGYCCTVRASKRQVEEARDNNRDRDYEDHKYRES